MQLQDRFLILFLGSIGHCHCPWQNRYLLCTLYNKKLSILPNNDALYDFNPNILNIKLPFIHISGKKNLISPGPVKTLVLTSSVLNPAWRGSIIHKHYLPYWDFGRKYGNWITITSISRASSRPDLLWWSILGLSREFLSGPDTAPQSTVSWALNSSIKSPLHGWTFPIEQ